MNGALADLLVSPIYATSSRMRMRGPARKPERSGWWASHRTRRHMGGSPGAGVYATWRGRSL